MGLIRDVVNAAELRIVLDCRDGVDNLPITQPPQTFKIVAIAEPVDALHPFRQRSECRQIADAGKIESGRSRPGVVAAQVDSEMQMFTGLGSSSLGRDPEHS